MTVIPDVGRHAFHPHIIIVFFIRLLEIRILFRNHQIYQAHLVRLTSFFFFWGAL